MTLKRDLVNKGSIFQSTSDTETIIHLVATSRYPTLLDRFVDALRLIEGAYSLICMTPEGMIACRDPLGIRPLVMGRIGRRGLLPRKRWPSTWSAPNSTRGRAGRADPGRSQRQDFQHRPFGDAPRPCIFEHVYFSRPDSVMGGQSVYEVAPPSARSWPRNPRRRRSGHPGARSGVPAAIGYAQESGIPFELGIIRSHYVGRTFIQPSDGARNADVKRKHNANRALIEGKRIVLIDDSIVRGTTSLKIVQMMRDAGASKSTCASPARRPSTRASMASIRPSAASCWPRAWIWPRWPISSRPTALPSSPSTASTAPWARKSARPSARSSATPASPVIIPPA
jgi:amidophosphoribosyltransferase